MNKKLNVLHLTFDMRIGGTEQVIKNLVDATDFNYFSSSVLCIEEPIGPFGEMLIEQGIPITALSRQPGFDTQLIKLIRAHIKQNDIDILHCHQYTPWVYGVLAAAFTKTKVIFTEHGRFYPDSSSWKRKCVNPVLAALTHSMTSISKATKDALVEYECLPRNRIEVVYNGISRLIAHKQKSAALKTELGIPSDANVVGTIARLDPIKNQTMMIKAFSNALAHYPDTYLVIVGDGEERETLTNLVNELSINEHVIFTGYEAKPVHHLMLMDIFLLSSLSEGTSMTLLEAMSLGKPCIVTDAGGNAEIIKDDFNGLVTPNDDETAFSNAMIQLLGNAHQWQSMSQNAHMRFKEFFESKKMAEGYMAIYRALCCQ